MVLTEGKSSSRLASTITCQRGHKGIVPCSSSAVAVVLFRNQLHGQPGTRQASSIGGTTLRFTFDWRTGRQRLPALVQQPPEFPTHQTKNDLLDPLHARSGAVAIACYFKGTVRFRGVPDRTAVRCADCSVPSPACSLKS
jgi:hypothetical protein